MLGSRELVEKVLEDHRTSPLPANEKALFAFIEKVNADSTKIGQADVDALKSLGWTDEAIYDAITVCALFQYYNTWIDATGVHDMPAAAYAEMGVRMATNGYTRPKP